MLVLQCLRPCLSWLLSGMLKAQTITSTGIRTVTPQFSAAAPSFIIRITMFLVFGHLVLW
jgi:hypothetical protein